MHKRKNKLLAFYSFHQKHKLQMNRGNTANIR